MSLLNQTHVHVYSMYYYGLSVTTLVTINFDRMGCIWSATVREGDRDDPVRLAVIVKWILICFIQVVLVKIGIYILQPKCFVSISAHRIKWEQPNSKVTHLYYPPPPPHSDELRALQMAEDDIKSSTGWLESESVPNRCPDLSSWKLKSLWTQRNELVMKDGVLYRKWQDIPGGSKCYCLQPSCFCLVS